jgi:hypothetical protein
MNTMEKKVKNLIAKGNSFESQESYKNFNQINAYYETLIKEGVVSKRGYCLKTISDVPIFKYDKNVI